MGNSVDTSFLALPLSPEIIEGKNSIAEFDTTRPATTTSTFAPSSPPSSPHSSRGSVGGLVLTIEEEKESESGEEGVAVDAPFTSSPLIGSSQAVVLDVAAISSGSHNFTLAASSGKPVDKAASPLVALSLMSSTPPTLQDHKSSPLLPPFPSLLTALGRSPTPNSRPALTLLFEESKREVRDSWDDVSLGSANNQPSEPNAPLSWASSLLQKASQSLDARGAAPPALRVFPPSRPLTLKVASQAPPPMSHFIPPFAILPPPPRIGGGRWKMGLGTAPGGAGRAMEGSALPRPPTFPPRR